MREFMNIVICHFIRYLGIFSSIQIKTFENITDCGMFDQNEWKNRRKNRLLLQYKLLNNFSPAYLSSIIPPTIDTRDLHTFVQYTLGRLNISTSFGLRLSEDGITLDIRNCDSIISFKRKLKMNPDIRRCSVYKCKKGVN